jgi:hypothetical protein
MEALRLNYKYQRINITVYSDSHAKNTIALYEYFAKACEPIV